jgi:hypothetical protein
MQEHFQAMQEAMQAMRGNAGTMMSGCMQCCCCQQQCGTAKGGKSCNKGGNCARGKGMGAMPQGGAAAATPQGGMAAPVAGMMEQRMDMMQMMMENMMEHQRQMQPSK